MVEIRINNLTWFPKNLFSTKDYAFLKASLTKTQRASGFYGDTKPKTIRMYDETGDRIGVPSPALYIVQNFLFHRKDLHYVDQRSGTPYEFPKPLFEYREGQKVFVEGICDGIVQNGFGGIGVAEGGFGKTICSLFCVWKLGLRTLVIVHKEPLLHQWRERIAMMFGSDFPVGHLQGDKLNLHPISIGMMQTLASRMYEQEVLNYFGLLVFDESHRAAAPTGWLAVKDFNTKYRLGLSATPYRNDGMEEVFKFGLGPIVAKSSATMPKPDIYKLYFRISVHRNDYTTWSKHGRKESLTSLVSHLVARVDRNNLITQHIVKAALANRKVMVLSERVGHLETLQEKIQTELNKEAILRRASLYTGSISDPTKKKGRRKMTQEELDAARKSNVILATWQMAKEGIDISDLDTLFMITPRSDVAQALYRIRRLHPDKKPLLVVDWCDQLTDNEGENVTLLEGIETKRTSYYRREKFNISVVEC